MTSKLLRRRFGRHLEVARVDWRVATGRYYGSIFVSEALVSGILLVI
jgi:hypothetical protein